MGPGLMQPDATDTRERLVRLETQLDERWRMSENNRLALGIWLGKIETQVTKLTIDMDRLATAFQAHSQADAQLLTAVQHSNGRVNLTHAGLGTGIGGGLAAAVAAFGKVLGWF